MPGVWGTILAGIGGLGLFVAFYTIHVKKSKTKYIQGLCIIAALVAVTGIYLLITTLFSGSPLIQYIKL